MKNKSFRISPQWLVTVATVSAIAFFLNSLTPGALRGQSAATGARSGTARSAETIIYGANDIAQSIEIDLAQNTAQLVATLLVGTKAIDQDHETGYVYYFEQESAADMFAHWNPATGTNTVVRTYTPAPGLAFKRMAFAPDGTLYVSDRNEILYTLNKYTGDITTLGPISGLISDREIGSGDMAFAPDGTCYVANDKHLFALDIPTRRATLLYRDLIVPQGSGQAGISGLACCDGMLYVSSYDYNVPVVSIQRIDPATGEIIHLFDTYPNPPQLYFHDLSSCAPGPPPNPPSAPGNLVASTVSSSQINLSWKDNSNIEQGAKIERRISGGVFVEIAQVGARVVSYSDLGLAPGTTYEYRVLAFNSAGNSDYSNTVSATTPGSGPPSAPGNLSATAMSSSQINLSWTDNSTNEDGFKIERKTGASGTYAQIAAVEANVTSYSSTGLAANTTYFYRVFAYNNSGNSGYSSEASATTQSGGGSSNLALNKPATASSTYGSYTPNRAVDGNTGTYWRSGSVSSSNPIAWLRVDLGSPQTISRTVVKWRSSYYAKQYELQVSNDEVSWITVYADNAGNGGNDDFTIASTTARYVRLYNKKNQKSNYRVNELEIYAGGGSLAPSHPGDIVADMLPEETALYQNYPNPFNPATTIAYSVPSTMRVTLKVYNIAGQEIATLVDAERESGVYEVDFEASHLPNGVYYSVLRAGEAIQVRRMVFVK